MINVFSVILLLLSSICLCYSTPQYYYQGSSSTYKWPRSYPQSCQCKEDGVTIKTCSIWQCTCACDLQAAVCDYNCCCDPDCSDSQIARFSDLDSCLPEGYGSDTTQYCYSSLELQKINPRPPLSGQATSMNAVGSALCVDKKNTPSNEEYYTDTATTDYSVFSTDSGKKSYYYPDPTITTYTADTYYDYGDNIAAFTYDGSSYKPIGRGYLRLPRAGDGSGECIDENYVKFEKSESTTCVRTFTADDRSSSAAAAKCAQLDYSYWVGDGTGASAVFVGATADITPTTAVSSSNVVVISAPTITTTTSTTTTTSNVFTDISTYVTNAFGKYTVDSTKSSSSALASVTSSATGCSNIVIGVKYIINHDVDSIGKISSVAVELTTATIAFPAASSTEVISIPFTYSVEFISGSTTYQSTTYGNTVERERSGNPGYNMGKPIVYGTLSTTIQEWTTGLTIPSPLVGQTVTGTTLPSASTCPTSTDVSSGLSYSSVSFGYDVSTGCMLSLTRTGLQAFCQKTSTTYLDSSGYSYFFYDSQTGAVITNGYVGIYGNADPLDPNQWLKIQVITPTVSPTWDDTNGICSGAITGIEYKFLVTQSGEKTHPQNKIIAAYATFVSRDLTWTSAQGDTASSVKNYPLTVTVSFINKNDAQLKGYKPPAPPVLFTVPYDVFYPFYESNSASLVTSTSYITILMIILSILLLLL